MQTNNSNSKIVNKDFHRAVKAMRRILPKISFSLLIGTYLITALIMGVFHSNTLIAEFGKVIGYGVAFLVPLAIQAGRGTLVFFFQLNPARMQGRFSLGAIAATVLLIISIVEAVLVSERLGVGVIVSACTLMLIGYIIEIMIMRETVIITQMELYENKDQWEALKEFYVAKEQFRQFTDDLNEGKYSKDYILPSFQKSKPSSASHPPVLENEIPELEKPQSNGQKLILSEVDKTFLEENNYHDIIAHLEGKPLAQLNGQHTN